MVLAIEADGASYRASGSVRDRDRLRGEHLQRLGWSFHRLWSTNWFHNPQAEVAKLRDAYDRAVAAADLTGPALADPEPGAEAERGAEAEPGAEAERAAEPSAAARAPGTLAGTAAPGTNLDLIPRRDAEASAKPEIRRSP